MREEGDLLHYDHQSERSDVRRRPANTQPRGGWPLQRGPEKAEVTPARGPRPGAACACVENEPRVALLSRSSTSSSAQAPGADPSSAGRRHRCRQCRVGERVHRLGQAECEPPNASGTVVAVAPPRASVSGTL